MVERRIPVKVISPFKLPPEALEDAQKAAIQIHVDCMGIIGKNGILSLGFNNDGETWSNVTFFNKYSEQKIFSKNRDVDLVAQRILFKLNKEKSIKKYSSTEIYVFRNTYYGDGHVMRETHSVNPYTINVEEVGKDELDVLKEEIRENSHYKEMVKIVSLLRGSR